ncbi:MAG: DUF2846 domain-containing protein [Gammaproteobacteria bacterium]|nr:DUF2846 domain-containing protein [Gammaproteobacteria bacterium]
MKIKLISALFITVSLVGCSSVPMQSEDASNQAKMFSSPDEGKSGVYIYRSGNFGGALKKDIWLDGKCIGESAPNVFFYEEVEGNKEHKISTESEFSPNDLIVYMEAGKNYFIEQFMKLGVFVGGAGLEQVDEEKGKTEVKELGLAVKGNCGK